MAIDNARTLSPVPAPILCTDGLVEHPLHSIDLSLDPYELRSASTDEDKRALAP